MNPSPIGKDRLIQLLRQVVDLKSEWASCLLPPELQEKLEGLESILLGKPEINKGMGLTAQVSLYPLRVTSLSPIINKALRVFDHFGLDVYSGSMSTLISGEDEGLWSALRNAFTAAAVQGEIVMTITVSNACPLPSEFKAEKHSKSDLSNLI